MSLNCSHNRPIVHITYMCMDSHGGVILTGENRRNLRKKPCPSVILFTTNPTWTDPGAKAGLCGKRQATNRLSYGTPVTVDLVSLFFHLSSTNSVIIKKIYIKNSAKPVRDPRFRFGTCIKLIN
jgi:hypothetical protein